jgi:CRISPR-associated protein Cmr6
MSRYLQVAVKEDGHNDAKIALYHSMQIAIENSKDLYKIAFNRYRQGLKNSTSEGLFRTKDGIRMVLGLGGENVLETGLTLHHVYGTPYIPGSALKGLASHYCDQVWGARENNLKWDAKDRPDKPEFRFRRGGEYYNLLFGTTEDSGHIIFHDAWIHPESVIDALGKDIMTPHHGEYYKGNGAPTDFDDPVPISFLSISGTFCIAVSCDIQNDDNGRKWQNLAFTILSEALEHWGIGGKTNAGYGRLQKDQQIPKVSPEYTTRLSIAGKTYIPPTHAHSVNLSSWNQSSFKKPGYHSGQSNYQGQKKYGSDSSNHKKK